MFTVKNIFIFVKSQIYQKDTILNNLTLPCPIFLAFVYVVIIKNVTNTESYSQQLMLLSHAIGKFLLPTFEVEITSSSQSSAFLTEITIMKDDSFIFSQHPTDFYSNVESHSLVTILTFTALSRYSACWRQCQNFAQICYFRCVQYIQFAM